MNAILASPRPKHGSKTSKAWTNLLQIPILINTDFSAWIFGLCTVDIINQKEEIRRFCLSLLQNRNNQVISEHRVYNAKLFFFLLLEIVCITYTRAPAEAATL